MGLLMEKGKGLLFFHLSTWSLALIVLYVMYLCLVVVAPMNVNGTYNLTYSD